MMMSDGTELGSRVAESSDPHSAETVGRYREEEDLSLQRGSWREEEDLKQPGGGGDVDEIRQILVGEVVDGLKSKEQVF